MNEYLDCPYIVAGSVAAYEGTLLLWTCGLYRRVVDTGICDECRLIQTRTVTYEPASY